MGLGAEHGGPSGPRFEEDGLVALGGEDRVDVGGDHLIAGVATDESLERMKGRGPIVPLAERMAMVAALRMVDSVVPDYDQDKRLAWKRSPFDVLFKGTDWEGTDKGRRLEAEMAEVGASVIYLPYTPTTSSTMLRRTLVQEVASRSPQGAK